MSVRVMAAVWEKFPQGGSALLAMLALADWSDDEGRCWPSMSSIATKLRLSRSQAQRTVHQLIDEGFLVVTGNLTGGYHEVSSRRYQIVIDRLTGSMGATGSTHATGSMDAADGSHGCTETGSMGATQTISEPPVNHQEGATPPVPETRSKKAGDVTFETWARRCNEISEKLIADYEPLWSYAERAGLTEDMLELCWVEFRHQYDKGGARASKRYRDWRRAFLNCVEQSWFRLWSVTDSGEYRLTSRGEQASRALGLRRAA